MYSTCLFCHSALGRNLSLEHLPVGRRVAYDPRRGRLWVVCGRCARWNLAPFDERWEALEECEAAFRASGLRSSTPHIGLAMLREGLELIRVGDAAAREFAGWRYGAEFVRRNTRTHWWDWLPLAAGSALALTTGGVILPLAGTALLGAPSLVSHYRTRLRRVGWIPGDDVPGHIIQAKHAARTRIVTGPGSDWSLEVPHDKGISRVARPAADHVILPLLASVNQRGCTRREVHDAVQELELVGTGPPYMAHVAAVHRSTRFGRLPRHAALALEMVAHEAAEQRALAGDMALLLRAWREAEEIAAIADGLTA